MNNRLLQVSGSPHIHSGDTVKKIMWAVVIALIPAFLVSVYYFGLPVIIITLVSIGSCLLFEFLIQKYLLKGELSITDGSAVITGLLLAFNLPPTLPVQWVILGALVAIGVGKMTFGGLGKNPFNPALLGRVFLLISRPVEMTKWQIPEPIWNITLLSDVMTGPSPMGILKEGLKNGETMDAISAKLPSYVDMLLGNMPGSFGEISAVALLLGAVYLMAKKILTWHIPVSFLASAFALATILYFVNPAIYVNPFFHMVTGGMLLGALFMATDMVTTPISPMGMIVFGVGCGLLTIVIRVFGAYPEGVSFCHSFNECGNSSYQ